MNDNILSAVAGFGLAVGLWLMVDLPLADDPDPGLATIMPWTDRSCSGPLAECEPVGATVACEYRGPHGGIPGGFVLWCVEVDR